MSSQAVSFGITAAIVTFLLGGAGVYLVKNFLLGLIAGKLLEK
ncbi:hypothetical protein [Alkalicoccus luteus]|nr:hypothetical protein [Alkalicoccus luteus]